MIDKVKRLAEMLIAKSTLSGSCFTEEQIDMVMAYLNRKEILKYVDTYGVARDIEVDYIANLTTYEVKILQEMLDNRNQSLRQGWGCGAMYVEIRYGTDELNKTMGDAASSLSNKGIVKHGENDWHRSYEFIGTPDELERMLSIYERFSKRKSAK